MDPITHTQYNFYEVRNKVTSKDLVGYYNNVMVLRYITRSTQDRPYDFNKY